MRLLAADGVVDPFSGVHVPTTWLVLIGVWFVLWLVALWCWAARRNTWDDRTAWNYGAAMIGAGLGGAVALMVVVNDVFHALGGLGGTVVGLAIAVALITYGNRNGRSRRRWP